MNQRSTTDEDFDCPCIRQTAQCGHKHSRRNDDNGHAAYNTLQSIEYYDWDEQKDDDKPSDQGSCEFLNDGGREEGDVRVAGYLATGL